MWYSYKNVDESIIMNALRRGWWKKRGRIFRIADSSPPLGWSDIAGSRGRVR